MPRYRLKYAQWEVPLPDGEFTVGRASSCDLRLDDKAISRHHATFHVEEDAIRVEDNDSRHGVFIDGRRVDGKMTVPVGAQVRMGQQAMVVVEVDPDKESVAWARAAPDEMTDVSDRALRPAPPLGSGPRIELTDRERQVLSLVARGFTQKEVSDSLGISTKTVETYLRRIRKKSGARTRANLVDLARMAGVIDEGS